MNLYSIVNDAISELREWHQDNPDETEIYDQIFTIADGSVPLNTHQLVKLAAENIALATNEPELGPANGSNFDGTPCPVNIIAANIFEYIEAALWEAWQEMQDDEEADDDDA